jgi:hypothetical protein
VAVLPSASADRFDIRLDDRDIAGTLRRWGARAGIAVAWETSVQAPVTGELRLPARTFDEAVRQVLAGLRAQGYPLRAEVAGDGRIRFVEAP